MYRKPLVLHPISNSWGPCPDLYHLMRRIRIKDDLHFGRVIIVGEDTA